MKLSENVRRRCRGFCIAICVILIGPLASVLAGTAGAAGNPKTVAETALYQGPDREQILIEGAKKEGGLTIYDSYSGIKKVAQAFEKKYPFIKVSEWRTASKEVFTKLKAEYTTGNFLADVVEVTELIAFLHREGILQEYYSPHIPFYDDDYKAKGKTGVYYMADREIYLGLGFNTKRVNPADAPKTLKDLLDPKWKGMISIAGTKTSFGWIGNAMEVMGRDFVEQLSRQDVKIQNISNAAVLGLVASGEVPLSPTIFRDNVFVAKKKGAPVEWRALEPVVTNIGSSGMTTKSPHPHAALLFLDYIHSREGQEEVMKLGPNSPRNDMGSPDVKFKKTIYQSKFSPEEFVKNFSEWENLTRKLFIKGK